MKLLYVKLPIGFFHMWRY